MAITRTAKGAASDKTGLSPWTALSSISMNAGDYLVVGLSMNGTLSSVTWNSISMSQLLSVANGRIYGLAVTGTATGSIVLNYSAAPTVQALFATSLGGVSSTGDVNSSASGTSATPQDTSVATNNANEIFIGLLITLGPSGDAAGTWSNSWSAGQRAGTTGGGATSNRTVQEGFKIVSATESSQAALTGITSRDWSIAHQTFQAAATGLTIPVLMISQAIKRASFY